MEISRAIFHHATTRGLGLSSPSPVHAISTTKQRMAHVVVQPLGSIRLIVN
jgi:hypothetical protein